MDAVLAASFSPVKVISKDIKVSMERNDMDAILAAGGSLRSQA